jgi:TetR/AcrR family transcriptional regulator, acrAB operon repressor
MTQEERSERSRAQILEAALDLFSHQGFRATSIRDIATKAGVSTGSVYHHFKDKEQVFETLLKQFRSVVESPEFPLYQVLARGAFPDRLEEVGRACREIVARWRSSVALIYVDVVEFEGLHIRAFYADMANLVEKFIEHYRHQLPLTDKLRNGVPPAAAMMMTFRIFFYYFVVEILFGVPNHYGMSSEDAIRVISDILQRGMMKQT